MSTITQIQQESVFSVILANLIKNFDGAHIVTPAEAGLIIGLKPNTTYSLIAKSEFPIALIIVSKRKMVRVADIAWFILKIGGDDIPPSLPPTFVKRGRGRPPGSSGRKARAHAHAAAAAADAATAADGAADAAAADDAIV